MFPPNTGFLPSRHFSFVYTLTPFLHPVSCSLCGFPQTGSETRFIFTLAEPVSLQHHHTSAPHVPRWNSHCWISDFFFLKTVQTVNFRSAFFRPHQYRAMRTLKIQPIQGYLGLLCGATGKRQEEETPSKLKHDGYHIDDDRPSKWVLFGQSGAGW